MARNLRTRGLFRKVVVDTVTADSGVVLQVITKDGWTTQVDVRFRSAGKQTDWQLALIERNLLGTGTRFATRYRHTPDRNSLNFQFLQPRLIAKRVSLGLRYEDRSDGARGQVAIERPFFSLSDRNGITTPARHPQRAGAALPRRRRRPGRLPAPPLRAGPGGGGTRPLCQQQGLPARGRHRPGAPRRLRPLAHPDHHPQRHRGARPVPRVAPRQLRRHQRLCARGPGRGRGPEHLRPGAALRRARAVRLPPRWPRRPGPDPARPPARQGRVRVARRPPQRRRHLGRPRLRLRRPRRHGGGQAASRPPRHRPRRHRLDQEPGAGHRVRPRLRGRAARLPPSTPSPATAPTSPPPSTG